MGKYASLSGPLVLHIVLTECWKKLVSSSGVEMVQEESKRITAYLYSDPWIVSTMRKFTSGMELIRPKIMRFATYFLSLRAIVIQEESLKHMFSHRWLYLPAVDSLMQMLLIHCCILRDSG